MAQDTRTRMLEKTATLLQHRGYYGTSLSDILEASAAPRGSLYFHFPGGKDQLVLEATRAAAEAATTELDHLLQTAETPASSGARLCRGCGGADAPDRLHLRLPGGAGDPRCRRRRRRSSRHSARRRWKAGRP